MKKILLSLLCLFCFSQLSAQDSKTGNWIMYFGNLKVNDKWNWHHEIQYRNYNFGSDLEQLLIRTGIGYNLTEGNNNLLLGYGFIRSGNYAAGGDVKLFNNEHRIYQQFITKQHFGRVYLQHRYRIEERFVEGSDFKMRFRYFLLVQVALNKKEIGPKTLYLSAYNELFINSKSPFFDRDRIYGALGYRISAKVKVELGYMRQFFEMNSRGQTQMAVFGSF